jgi:hypothetical protein
VLAALVEAADVGAGFEGDVVVVEAGEFGDAETGLGGEGEQRPVSSSFPAVLVRGGEQGGELGLGEDAISGRSNRLGGMASTRRISSACSGCVSDA